MRQAVLLLLLFTAMPSIAAAQPADRGSVSGMVGGGRTWDDESNIGGGLAAGGRVDFRVFGNTRLEVSADLLRHERTPEPVGAFGAEGTSGLFGASLVHRFGQSTAQPYVLGGVDIVTHSGTTTFDQVTTDRESTNFGYHFGGGVAVRVGSRFEIGPEARFFIMQAGDDGSAPSFAYWIGARFGVRF
jgi:opacity protein-like surface antigen